MRPLWAEKDVHLQAVGCEMVCSWAGRARGTETRSLDPDGLQNPPLVVIEVPRKHHIAGLLCELAEEVREICLWGGGQH